MRHARKSTRQIDVENRIAGDVFRARASVAAATTDIPELQRRGDSARLDAFYRAAHRFAGELRRQWQQPRITDPHITADVDRLIDELDHLAEQASGAALLAQVAPAGYRGRRLY